MSASTPEGAALALTQAGRLGEAEAAWRAILARKPDEPSALHFLGCVLARTGRGAEGLALIDRSLALAPRNAMFLNNRARVLADTGRVDDAVSDLRRAVQADPRFFAALFHLGSLLRSLGRHDEAITALRRACALDPANADALLHLGYALQLGGRLDEAMAHYARAVEVRPGFPEALLNWGNAHKDRGDLDAAAQFYERALAARPDFVEALLNAAGAALDRERLAEAKALYERALAREPANANATYGLGQIALREQRFAAGWNGYEARFDTRPAQAVRRGPALPRLDTTTLAGARRVAIWAEQGIGDQILFSTLLPELERHGVKAVIEVDARLLAAYRRSLPALEFTTPKTGDRPRFPEDGTRGLSPVSSCDYQLPIGSLPALVRTDAASFQRQPAALLLPDPARVEAMRRLLPPGRWIAISWRSLQKGERHALAHRKSIPLEHFAALAHAAGARLLDLQYGDVDEERRAFDARHPGVLHRIEGLDVFADLEGVMAAMSLCERVVTASNVTAHLAGAIGKAAIVAYLRGWPPFHYWAAAPGGRSWWYPSVEVTSDPAHATWDALFEKLAGMMAR
jgi:tetratricopeptide (TPR) repeat protein